MPYNVSILQSEGPAASTAGRRETLIGSRQHNDQQCSISRTTTVFPGPWKGRWTRECAERAEAMSLERGIKKRRIERYLDSAQPAESRDTRVTGTSAPFSS